VGGVVLDLNDLRLFVEVVDSGGFSAASRAFDRPTSTISHRIQQLERELGLKLLARTSRSVVMTEAGKVFYDYASSVIDLASEAEGIMRGRSNEAVGTVRYSVGMGIAQFAMPAMLASFMAKYPRVKLIQHVSNDIVDIVADRFDLAIRCQCKRPPDSQLVQRSLVKDLPWRLYASPEYVEERGPFREPQDLEGVETLFMRRDQVEPTWRLAAEDDPDAIVEVRLQPRVLGVCIATLKEAAANGLGIVALPDFSCREELRSGRLKQILPGYTAIRTEIMALMPHRRGMTAAVRVFIDHIAAAFPGAVSRDTPSPQCLCLGAVAQ
jgi:DNA-binding transcriptional LysR family regulator